MLRKLNWNLLNVKLLMLSLIMIGLFVSQSAKLQAQTNSAPNSPGSATRADDEGLRRACAEAVEELKAARKLLAAQKVEIEKQEQLLKLEEKISGLLRGINKLSEEERSELRKALAAKDRVIASLESANETLKKRQMTFGKVFKIVVVSTAAGFLLAKILK